MHTSTLRILAAGLTACVCLSGLSGSANAQFFSNDNSIQSPNGPLAAEQRGLYDSRMPQQWQDQRRMDERYLRTNVDGAQAYDRTDQSRCENGSCRHRPTDGLNASDGTAYRNNRRSQQGYDSASRYRSRSALTTSWDPANAPVDPTTGLPMERPRRRDHANGEGYRGQCRGGECRTGQCDCPEGQCDCPIGQRHSQNGQFRQRRMDQQNAPTGYDDFNLTRRNNATPQYLPTRNPYLN